MKTLIPLLILSLFLTACSQYERSEHKIESEKIKEEIKNFEETQKINTNLGGEILYNFDIGSQIAIILQSINIQKDDEYIYINGEKNTEIDLDTFEEYKLNSNIRKFYRDKNALYVPDGKGITRLEVDFETLKSGNGFIEDDNYFYNLELEELYESFSDTEYEIQEIFEAPTGYKIYISKTKKDPKDIIQVSFQVKELIDYDNCIIDKQKFEVLKENTNIFNYDDFCIPKYELTGTIKSGEIDEIIVRSCGKDNPYTLQQFNKGDETFIYNISKNNGNYCSSFSFRYFLDGEKLGGESYFLKKDDSVEYVFEGGELVEIENDYRGYLRIKNKNHNDISIILEEGRGGSYNFIIREDKIYTKLLGSFVFEGFYFNHDYVCGAIDDGYILIDKLNNNKEMFVHLKDAENWEKISMQNFYYTGYTGCANFIEIPKKEYEALGKPKEIEITEENINQYIYEINTGYNKYTRSKLNNYKMDFGINRNNIGGWFFEFKIGDTINFYENQYTGNYSFLIYDKDNNLLKYDHIDGMDGAYFLYYHTFINGERQ